MTKVGLLIPQSQAYKTIGRDFVRGFKFLGDNEVEVIIEGIGVGNDTDLTTNLIDKLVIQNEVDIIVGLVGDFQLDVLYNKINGLEIPTIFARVGAFPNIQPEQNEYGFTLSYGLSEGLYKLGGWFVENSWNKVATSGSFNDIGYGLVRALELALYNAGGEFAGHRTTPLKQEGNEAEIAQKFYESIECDVICEFYNGDFAAENVDYMRALEGNIDIPLMYTPFSLNSDHLQVVGEKAKSLSMYAPWLSQDLTGEISDFDKRYFEKHDKYPEVSNWLGYQAALAVRDLIPNRKEILKGKKQTFGETEMAVCSEDLVIQYPIKIWKAENNAGKWEMKPSTTFEAKYDIPEPFEGQVTGWHNAYLCY
jgi:hypothetical protein